jgi:hypothetical protein
MGVCDIENNVSVVVTLFLLLPIHYRNVDPTRHITTLGCYIEKIKNKAECLYHTFVITSFN